MDYKKLALNTLVPTGLVGRTNGARGRGHDRPSVPDTARQVIYSWGQEYYEHSDGETSLVIYSDYTVSRIKGAKAEVYFYLDDVPGLEVLWRGDGMMGKLHNAPAYIPVYSLEM